jgi:hypothetical protein
MGGSTGRLIDQTTGFISGGHGTNLEKEANKLQTHYEKQWQGLTDRLGTPELPGAEELAPALETSTESNNPFSMASYGNNVRQRRKSGFGRRQTFKGLTG